MTNWPFSLSHVCLSINKQFFPVRRNNGSYSVIASSRRSVNKAQRRKQHVKKTPVGKLYKRSFCPLIDHLQRSVTWPPACGFQLSTFLWNMLTEYFKLCPSNWKPTLRDLKTICNRNKPKQSINTAWQITLQSKRSIYRKQNDKCRDVTNRIYRSLHKIWHFLVRQLIRIAIAATPAVFNCLTWSFTCIMALRARQTTMIV